MKKLCMFILCLALVSLACLDTSAAMVLTAAPSQMPTRFEVTAFSTAAVVEALPTMTLPAQLCAVVVADEAVHLRGFSGISSRIIGFLNAGDVVQVVSRNNADWWQVKHGEAVGFARSSYLKIVDCEVSNGIR